MAPRAAKCGQKTLAPRYPPPHQARSVSTRDSQPVTACSLFRQGTTSPLMSCPLTLDGVPQAVSRKFTPENAGQPSRRACIRQTTGPSCHHEFRVNRPKPFSMRSLNQCQIGVHLYAIERKFRAGRGYVEVANDEIRRKLGEEALGTRSKIEEPKVLVADFTTKKH